MTAQKENTGMIAEVASRCSYAMDRQREKEHLISAFDVSFIASCLFPEYTKDQILDAILKHREATLRKYTY